MMIAEVEFEPTVSAGMASRLSTDEYVRGALNAKPNYDVARDGQRLIMMRNVGQTGTVADQTVLTVVDNWFEELNRLAPPAGEE